MCPQFLILAIRLLVSSGCRSNPSRSLSSSSLVHLCRIAIPLSSLFRLLCVFLLRAACGRAWALKGFKSCWEQFQFFRKISIFQKNFNFSEKFQFFRKISFFEKNFVFWEKFRFLTKIQFFDQNSVFYKIPVFTKIAFSDQNSVFLPKFRFLRNGPPSCFIFQY